MSIDSREFRNALGRFATGVCVITANPDGHAPFGMTVNSFASVSLDPPLVLWSLQNNSECYPAFELASGFTVNILAHDQQALSNLYAKKGDHALRDDHYRLGRNGHPILLGALTCFECSTHAWHEGGDHKILVGKVEDVIDRPTGKPLVFYSGSYGEIR